MRMVIRAVIFVVLLVCFLSSCGYTGVNSISATHESKKNKLISMVENEQELLARVQEELKPYEKLIIDIHYDGEVNIYNSDETSMYYYEKESISCWEDIEYLIEEYDLFTIGYAQHIFYLTTRYDDAEHRITLSQDKVYEEDDNYENIEGDWYYSFFGFV